MRKIMMSLIAGGVVLSAVVAQAEVFPVSVNIPKASSANYVVWKLVDGQPFPSAPEASTAIAFTTKLIAADGVFLGNQYYAIDVAPSGGVGQMNVLIEYTKGSNPNGVNPGLEVKGIATVVKADAQMVGGIPVHDEETLEKTSFQNINGKTILASTLTGGAWSGFMRMYLGLATGNTNPAVGAVDPAGVVPFNLGDKPGDYTGTITLTASTP